MSDVTRKLPFVRTPWRGRMVGFGASLVAVLIVVFLGPSWLVGPQRAVAAYDAGALVLICMFWFIGMHGHPQDTQCRAAVEDPGRNVVLGIVLLSVVGGLASAISIIGRGPHANTVAEKAFVYGLGFGAVFLGWFLIHTLFTFRYAHMYYFDDDGDSESDRGLKFPGTEDVSREDAGPPRHVPLFQRHFVLAVLAQFLYVGAQVGTWSYFILYVRSSTGLGDKAAGYMLTGTLAAFAVGRFSSAWLMRHFHARKMLGFYAVANVVLGLVGVTQPNWVGVCCILTTSFFMSIMFPTIFALGLKGMGDKTKTAGSLLVMAILGGAALTKLMGLLRDAKGLEAAYLVPVACFAAVALYAWFGGEHEPAVN